MARWSIRSRSVRSSRVDALGVVAGDHRADVGQSVEHVEAASGEVDGVHLDRMPAGLGGQAGADGDAAQRDGLAGPAGAQDQQPAVGVGSERRQRLQLPSRLVAHAEHDRQVVTAARQTTELVAGGERRQPRSARRADAGQLERAPVVGDEALQVARVLGRHDGPTLLRDGGVVVEAEQPDPRHRRLHVGERVAADVGALERHQLLRADAGDRPAGQPALDRRRDRRADDVGRLVVGGHPQRHAQVRVGADLTGDHTGRALRGEHEVEAEAAAAQGDVDDAVHELGDLLGQRGELVDHDQQARRRVGMALALHLDEVLGVGLLEQQLAVVQLGVERDERPSHLVAVEVGDHADGVREGDALLERGTALVVDEQERDPLRAVHRRPARRSAPAGTPTCRPRSCRRRGRADRPGEGRARTARPTACRPAPAGRGRGDGRRHRLRAAARARGSTTDRRARGCRRRGRRRRRRSGSRCRRRCAR